MVLGCRVIFIVLLVVVHVRDLLLRGLRSVLPKQRLDRLALVALPLQLRNFLLDSFLLLVRHERVDELIATLESPFILLSEQAFLYNQLLLRLLGQVSHVDFADLLILVTVQTL